MDLQHCYLPSPNPRGGADDWEGRSDACVYTHAYPHVYAHVYPHVYKHVDTDVYMHVYTHVYTHVHKHVYTLDLGRRL